MSKMKKSHNKISQLFTTLLMSAIVILSPLLTGTALAAPAQIYITPNANNVTVGASFTVQVRFKTTAQVNAGFMHIYYDAAGLKVTSVARGTSFPTANAPIQNTPGHLYIESTRQRPQFASFVGDFQYAVITFQATAAGSRTASIGTNSRLLYYPNANVAYSASGAAFNVNPVPAPTPPPAPTPATNPTNDNFDDIFSDAPSGGGGGTADAAPVDSPVSSDGQQINDFTISGEEYHSVMLSWQTLKPANSRVNYGTNQNDLKSEQKSDELVTDHKMKLEGEALKAGTHYYIRVSADGEGEPITADSEFTTKAIAVLVTVTDPTGEVVADASVSGGDASETTDENGQATLNLPEGQVTINAQKDDYSKQTTETIKLPTDDIPQTVGLVLAKTTSKTAGNSSSSGPNILLFLLIFPIGGIIFILVRRLRQPKKQAYTGDILDIERYPIQRP